MPPPYEQQRGGVAAQRPSLYEHAVATNGPAPAPELGWRETRCPMVPSNAHHSFAWSNLQYKTSTKTSTKTCFTNSTSTNKPHPLHVPPVAEYQTLKPASCV